MRKVSPEQTINAGEPLATLEAMKMLRQVNAPHGGVVKVFWPKTPNSPTGAIIAF